MATGQVQHAAKSFSADGVAAALRLGRDGSGIFRSSQEQLALEGKLFIAGVGIEGTALTGRTALDDTTPDIWLQSPSGGNVLIRPTWLEIMVTAEGGAAPDWYLAAVGANIAIATAGTTVTPLSFGKVGGTSAAILQTLPTVGAITNAQNVRLASSESALDNLISVEHATGANTDKEDMMSSLTRIRFEFPYPLYLADGQAIAFYSATGTTGQGLEWTLAYTELDAEAHR